MGEEEEGGLKMHIEIVIPPYCFHLFTPFPRLGLVEKKNSMARNKGRHGVITGL